MLCYVCTWNLTRSLRNPGGHGHVLRGDMDEVDGCLVCSFGKGGSGVMRCLAVGLKGLRWDWGDWQVHQARVVGIR